MRIILGSGGDRFNLIYGGKVDLNRKGCSQWMAGECIPKRIEDEKKK